MKNLSSKAVKFVPEEKSYDKKKTRIALADDDSMHQVNVNDFLETMMSDPGPHCVSWLIVLHR